MVDPQPTPWPILPFLGIFAGLLLVSYVPTVFHRARERSPSGWERRADRMPLPLPPLVPPTAAPTTSTPAISRVTMRRLSLGFDWTVRRALQQALVELSKHARTDEPARRREAAREVLALMRAHVRGARYIYLRDEPLAPERGPRRLVELAIELRARYAHETRGRGEASPRPDVSPRADEGEGLLVVTLLMGESGASPAVPVPYDRATLAGGLEALLAEESPLLGLEVIWSPAEDEDRLSSYELERIYPELTRLRDAGQTVGTVHCGHCSAPRPTELRFCPHCGSPKVREA